ncbi:MAG: porphobilinogen synthase [Bdellovibrio sp. CG12_big_fil_rev_8_21_14_0_65_39_13]|nr:MAG: porphobilinogen synthase [Bdellovibrio sp. CG22_combo_CG10-13_8_21_14_all_39_27]PIQ62987.1 MAG: porphobilinogen synthase [Bdellovibrio sp. CG12_big_fil_rev_8_21_14_0_65_39_13]PIR32661.1 MAG: porphobilinogen synthase [Bdellovibrio sp. CG11_big_fil_rev_8_21_14_0_20_39_38]PJB53182.1 MAG: porphobilinogen synthase [Bdellovibrio sp. CG_4_9_14_3_um_filter_39_7]
MQLNRPRRNRRSSSVRSMVAETVLTTNDLLAPLFVVAGQNQRIPIQSMPGQFRFSIDQLIIEAKEIYSLGIPAVAVFPAIEGKLKNPKATEAVNPDGLYSRALRAVKEAVPELTLMTDIALDPYNSDGHDGLVDAESGEILNDQTLEILSQMAVLQANCGADIVGPSDMMDGRVGAIRKALEGEGYHHTLIMSYCAKYASSFYGPFRDALDSAPKAGDKKTYQMNPANIREALREAQLDEQEGADILMVKPGLPYLDVIKSLRESSHLPIAAYNVSGEYAMIKAAAEKGWLDGERAMMEMLLSFKRAGTDIILTYFAKEAAKIINS